MPKNETPVPKGFRVVVIKLGHDFLLRTGEFGRLMMGGPDPQYFGVAGSNHEVEEILRKYPDAVSVPMTINYQ